MIALALALGCASDDVVWRDVVAGQGSTCGLTDRGEVFCWGWLAQGPGRVLAFAPDEGPFVGVGLGGFHWNRDQNTDYLCAWNAAGDVTCSDGARARGLHDVAVASAWACGLDATNLMSCFWGDWTDGPIMIGAVPLVPMGQFDVAMSEGCGLTEARAPVCWGWRDDPGDDIDPNAVDIVGWNGGFTSLLADGKVRARKRAPAPPDAGAPWSELLLTGATTCALDPTGHPKCFAENDEIVPWAFEGEEVEQDFGQLDEPDVVLKSLSGQGYHLCGLDLDDQIVCWGGNVQGQLHTPVDPRRSVTEVLAP